VAPKAAAETAALLQRIRRAYVPNRTLSVVDPSADAPLPSLLQGKTQLDGRPTVYVCRHRTCSAPATEWAEVERMLQP
jgi:uncharacterized protein YyaL (SSP411 family)